MNSNVESEYIAAFEVAKEAVWIHKFNFELKRFPPLVYQY